MLLTIILYVIFALALWKIFEKMGTDGWRGIIPVYNIYVLFEKLWDVKGFLKYVISAIIGAVFFGISTVLIGGFTLSVMLGGGGFGTIIAAVILLLAGIVMLIYCEIVWIRLLYRLSKAFGHGVGFTVGLVFIPYIMLLILAFGKSTYNRDGDGNGGYSGNGNPYNGPSGGYTGNHNPAGNPVNGGNAYNPQYNPYPSQSGNPGQQANSGQQEFQDREFQREDREQMRLTYENQTYQNMQQDLVQQNQQQNFNQMNQSGNPQNWN